MALSGAASQLRCAVLQHLRIPVSSAGMLPSLRLWDLPSQFRGFAGGSYLDKDEVTQRVLNVAKHFEKVDPGKVSSGAHFEKDLGLDSLDVVELVMAIEEEFAIEIPDSEADKIFTVDDAVNFIASHPQAK